MEEIPRLVKLGPPTMKRKPNGKTSKKKVDISQSSPGPSTQKVMVLMPSIGSLVSYKNLKKRKADEDVEKAGPLKIAKTDHPKKSNRLEAKGTSSKASGVSYRSYLRLTESLTIPQRIMERS